MNSSLRNIARTGCAISLIACADGSSPTALTHESADAPAPAVISLMMAPTPEELAEMPSEFAIAPSIISARTEVGFAEGDGAYAQGVMEYFATNAEQDVTLAVRKDGSEIARKTTRGVNDDFFPARRSLRTNVAIPLSGSCGHFADGQSAHRAWHKFLVMGWKLFSWGQDERPSQGDEEQVACPPPPPERDSGGEDPYESGCQSCQQWFWYEDGQIVDEWWECTPTDSWRCDNRAT